MLRVVPVVIKEIRLALYLVSGINRNEFRKCLLFASLLYLGGT